ncbi:unnamed protein product [Auanema sp. JU1783]|nr:unnamed protein product [Auanema sp. JU1783]
MESGKQSKSLLWRVPKAPLFHPLSRRFHLILLLSTGFCCTTFMRMQIALTMTCMINSTAVSLEEEALRLIGHDLNISTSFLEPDLILDELGLANVSIVTGAGGGCTPEKADGKHVIVDYGGTLTWTHNQQNLIFGGTFTGALFVCLPGMLLVQRGSARLVLLAAMMTYVASSLVTPYLALNVGYIAVFIARVVMGFGEGLVIPSINSIIALWFPMEERSTALALFTTGNQLAGAAGNPFAAAMCASSWGWTSIFYVCGTVGSLWSLIWLLTSSNQPNDCKYMTKKERKYLRVKMPAQNKSSRKQSVPYMKVLTSPAFLAQLQCHFVINAFMTLLQLYLPSYLKDVLKLGVMTNGIYIAIPNIFNFVFKVIWGLFMDKMKEKKVLTPTAAVKLSQVVANLGSAVCLVIVAFFVDCSNKEVGLALFCTTFLLMGTFTSGFYTSLLSLAPRYTATLSSISQFVAMLGRLSTPITVGLVKQTGSIEEWRQLFCVAAAVSVLSGLVFAMFGSGEIQDWGRDDNSKPAGTEEIVELVKKHRTESICD